jgi:hypothetical protein
MALGTNDAKSGSVRSCYDGVWVIVAYKLSTLVNMQQAFSMHLQSLHEGDVVNDRTSMCTNARLMQ